jgi:hypothetical protein
LTHSASFSRLIVSTAVLIGAAVLLSACAGTPTPISITTGPEIVTSSGIGTAIAQTQVALEVAAALTDTAHPQTATPDAADGRPTLPPTWTPTFTPTAAPPTATITPTATPTVTQTLSAEDICDTFYLTTNLNARKIFAWDHKITLYVDTASADATVHFLAVHHFSGENRAADMPGGQANILQIPVKNLPSTGQYDWTLVIKSPAYGDICSQSGWFITAGRNSTRPEEDRMR